MPETEPTPKLNEQLEALLSSQELWPRTYARIAELGPGAAPALAKIIRERSHGTKFTQRAVLALGAVGGAPEAALLEALLGDPEPRIRIGAVTALRDIGTTGHVPAVEALLADPEPAVRKEAVKTLAQLGGPHGIEALRRVAENDPEGFLREQAGQAAAEAQSRLADAKEEDG
jgi:HEAT repeat protein